MANPISKELEIGTIGEMLVQIRLLQLGIQASIPLKDSGNDLIALKQLSLRTIQVKTTTIQKLPNWPTSNKYYHLLALVKLYGHDTILELDKSSIYLIPKDELPKLKRSWDSINKYHLTQSLVDQLF